MTNRQNVRERYKAFEQPMTVMGAQTCPSARWRRWHRLAESVLLQGLLLPAATWAQWVGRVTIVYQEDEIERENRDAMKKIRDSGVFERMADRLTKAVALPHDLQVVVTDNVPKGIDDPTTEVDGRRIFWPAAFSKTTHDVLTEFLPEVIASKGAPMAISQEKFTADVLNMWSNQF